MAGAGYKLFNTGDVLTAAQVNTYLMEQTVMVFADAAARTAALSGVVSEGMISYLKDTNAVEVYNGSAWVASDDPNAIQNTIVDAKGDLISASAADTPARLAVGNNGETLVADSSASTGLRWQADFSVGRNKIINGDFAINQRGFTSTTTTNDFGFDRWRFTNTGGTGTYSAQTFTTGAAPVAGYEGKNFARVQSSGQSASSDVTILRQFMESVRTLAGQTVTVSFWAKAASGTPKVAVELSQYFGGGGGSTDVHTYAGQVTLSTSWARYSVTVAVPSIAGKTVGTSGDDTLRLNLFLSAGSTFDARTGSLGIQSNTFDLWGVQLEAGNVATAFQTATGSLQGELAACQRYYVRWGGSSIYESFSNANCPSTTTASAYVIFPVEMRTAPSSVGSNAVAFYDGVNVTALTSPTLNANVKGTKTCQMNFTATGLTQYRYGAIIANNSTSAYLEINAEL